MYDKGSFETIDNKDNALSDLLFSIGTQTGKSGTGTGKIHRKKSIQYNNEKYPKKCGRERKNEISTKKPRMKTNLSTKFSQTESEDGSVNFHHADTTHWVAYIMQVVLVFLRCS